MNMNQYLSIYIYNVCMAFQIYFPAFLDFRLLSTAIGAGLSMNSNNILSITVKCFRYDNCSIAELSNRYTMHSFPLTFYP